MKRKHSKIITKKTFFDFPDEYRSLSYKILNYANRGILRIDFLRRVTNDLLDFSGCDAVELRLKEGNKFFRCEFNKYAKQPFYYKSMPLSQNSNGENIPCLRDDSVLEKVCKDIVCDSFDASSSFFTKNGSFWTDNNSNINIQYPYNSIALIPIIFDNEKIGILQLKSKKESYFNKEEIELYEEVARNLGIALTHRYVHISLRERIKELMCLYEIAQLVEQPGISLKGILQGIADTLPPAWLYPETASARIILDGNSYSTKNYKKSKYAMTADIVVNGNKRGTVEVSYSEEKPDLDEGPFLKEERSLIDTVATQVSLIIERRQSEDEKSNLQEQLRHADRLATIGQLAAGVAHELNEPLGNILGFAQLAKKCSGLPKQAYDDMDKIINSSLYTREIVKKLLLFARQMPPQKTKVDLNQLISNSLTFFESRCSKAGVKLIRQLSINLPKIIADPSHLTQVLVNLIINALQAMPKGGKLIVKTAAVNNNISIVVEDTGVGMGKDVIKQIFIPFFTTKDVNEGTGLGLSVVHGIVTAHKGTIKVESKPGIGTKFEVILPAAK